MFPAVQSNERHGDVRKIRKNLEDKGMLKNLKRVLSIIMVIAMLSASVVGFADAGTESVNQEGKAKAAENVTSTEKLGSELIWVQKNS